MVEEHDDLQRSLDLARSALRAPPAVKARVRARLAAGAGAPTIARTFTASTSHAVARAALWLGVGLCAGYWLGFHRVGASLGEVMTNDAEGARVAAPAREAAQPLPASVSSAGPEGRASAAGDTSATSDALAGGASASARPAAPRASSAVEGGLDRHAPVSEKAAAQSSSGPPRAHRSEPGSGNAFGEELALLGRAERAIRAGEGPLARSFLDELDQRFPASSLREERAAARVLTDCAEARTGTPAARHAAQAAATRLLSRSASMYADRVRQLCQLDLHEGVGSDIISGDGTAGAKNAAGADTDAAKEKRP